MIHLQVQPNIKGGYQSDSPWKETDLCLSKMYKEMGSAACEGIKSGFDVEKCL